MNKIIQLPAAKKRLEQKKYAKLVLDSFDKLEHDEKRKLHRERSAVEQKAKKAL